TFISFSINESDNEIIIFFDNQSFDLIGWQTKDIYQNTNITILSSIKKNEIIEKDIFKLPIQN
ncbi:outer membrane lipoprotein carrier protein LolA, partial [Candidatus Pelagibacter bacterium]|nr:outer membrane lipoprotein carrier protein LolA [Candidatus Pelagibacter bacterium]